MFRVRNLILISIFLEKLIAVILNSTDIVNYHWKIWIKRRW